MKLEDIKLQSGDKITLDDGTIVYVNKFDIDIDGWNTDCFSKVERYEKMPEFEQTANSITISAPNTYKLVTIYERKEILDKKEQEYLRNVIRPFRDKIISITKIPYYGEYINICYKEGKCNMNMGLPSFIENTMYKGMELNKEYSLEELGL